MRLLPQALPRARKSTLTRVGTLATATAIAAGTFMASGPAASAAPQGATTTSTASSTTQSSGMTARQRFAYEADRVLRVASNQKGDPYRYGATGPSAFDCSGLVYFTFRKALGRTLPRTADEQRRAAKRIWHRANLRPGDLVFEVSGHYAYHVGIYAGHGYFWHAPHSGTVVQKQKMYSAHWRFGRIIKS